MTAAAPRPGYADLFCTPLITFQMPDHDQLNAAFRSRILERQAQDPAGVQHSNVNGWHSDADMLDWGGAPAQRLGQTLCDLCTNFTLDPGSPAKPRFGWHLRMWANVSGPGAANQTHAHPGAFWSAAYYVDDGGCADDPAKGGELCLVDPRYPMTAMAAPDIFMRGADGRPKQVEQLVRPKPGLIVIFPSWLQHAVRPYKGDALRISIATNLTVVPKV